MGLFSGIFGGRNPASAAEPYLNQVPDVQHQYLDPYAEGGQQAYGKLSPQYEQLLSNPQEFFNQILSGYKPSAGYDYKSKQLLQTAKNAAAAGGYGGTGYDQQAQEELLNGLLGQDMQQYVNNILGLYGTGLQGYEGLSNQGYGASNELANNLSTNLQSQGTLAYSGIQGKNQQRDDLLMALLGGGSSILAGPLGEKLWGKYSSKNNKPSSTIPLMG